jgi:hypothetical protein
VRIGYHRRPRVSRAPDRRTLRLGKAPDSLARLYGAGLVDRLNEFYCATRAAITAGQLRI